MKKIIIFFVLILFIHNLFGQDKPEIVWDDTIILDTLTFPRVNDIIENENGYIFVTTSSYYVNNNPTNSPAIIETDFNGNLLFKSETVLTKNFRSIFAKKDLDNYSIFGYYQDNNIPCRLLINKQGDLIDSRILKYPNVCILQYSTFKQFSNKFGAVLTYFNEMRRKQIFFNDTLEIIKEFYLDTLITDEPIFEWTNKSYYDTISGEFYHLYASPNINAYNYSDYGYIVKYDSLGKHIWTTKIEKNDYSKININEIVKLNDDNLLIYSIVKSKDNIFSIRFTKIDNSGNIISDKIVYENLGYIPQAKLNLLSDNRIMISGYEMLKDGETQQKTFVSIFSNDNTLIEAYSWYSSEYPSYITYSYETKKGNIIIVSSPKYHKQFPIAEIKLKTTKSIENQILRSNVNIYPNPAKTNVSIDFIVEPENLPNISVELYNLTGILQSKLDYNVDFNNSNGQGTLNCNIENIPNGYYIIVIDNGKRKVAKPFIVNKE